MYTFKVANHVFGVSMPIAHPQKWACFSIPILYGHSVVGGCVGSFVSHKVISDGHSAN